MEMLARSQQDLAGAKFQQRLVRIKGSINVS